MDVTFKNKFIERYSNLTDWDIFKEYILRFLKRSIRVNTLKIDVDKLIKKMSDKWIFKKIPWTKDGFWIENKKGRRDIGNTIEHTLGYFYVQGAASQIPANVLKPKKESIVLDMCASPGGKTTQIASIIKNTGIIIANEIDYTRMSALNINLQRCGVYNTIITKMDGLRFKKTRIKFDYVLIDAPCSATGTIRKDYSIIKMWNPNMIKKLSKQQKKLIETGFDILKQNGTLVYSTCTLEPEENEEVIDYLLNKNDNAKIENIELDIKRSEPILEFEGKKYNKEIKKTLRIWPQDNDTEGFFVAKIKKI